jgi:hypothetical protein
MISPHFGKLEAQHPGIKFVKVDVEEQAVSEGWFYGGALNDLG